MFLVHRGRVRPRARRDRRAERLRQRPCGRAHVRAGVLGRYGPCRGGARHLRPGRDRRARDPRNLLRHPRSHHARPPGQRRGHAVPQRHLLHRPRAQAGGRGPAARAGAGWPMGRARGDAAAGAEKLLAGRGLPPGLLRQPPRPGLLRLRRGAEGGEVPQDLRAPPEARGLNPALSSWAHAAPTAPPRPAAAAPPPCAGVAAAGARARAHAGPHAPGAAPARRRGPPGARAWGGAAGVRRAACPLCRPRQCRLPGAGPADAGGRRARPGPGAAAGAAAAAARRRARARARHGRRGAVSRTRPAAARLRQLRLMRPPHRAPA